MAKITGYEFQDKDGNVLVHMDMDARELKVHPESSFAVSIHPFFVPEELVGKVTDVAFPPKYLQAMSAVTVELFARGWDYEKNGDKFMWRALSVSDSTK